MIPPVSPAAHGQGVTGQTTLAQLKDRARPLLIFAAKPDDPQLEIQIRTLKEHASAVQERDVVPVTVVYNNPEPATAASFAPEEALAVRRRFNVPPDMFTVILIGKDGGEKLRSSKPLSMEKLNETIDSMPMRQEEMKHPQR